MISADAPQRPIGELSGPVGRRWSGNLRAFESDRLGFLLRAKAEFGGLVRFDDLTTIVNDPQLAGQILLDRDEVFAIRENFRGETLSQADIAETRRLRPTLNPGMRRGKAALVVPRTVALTTQALDRATGECTDPFSMLEEISSRSVASYFFGSDGDGVVDASRDLLDALESHFGNAFALPATWPTPSRRRIMQRHRRLESLVVPLLRARLRRAAPPEQDLAAGVVRTLGGGGASLERVAQMLIGAFLAAQRVPAAAAAWMLWEVARDKTLQERLREEEVERFASETSPRVMDLPVATAVVLETLRLHPPTWLLHRTLLRDADVGGYAVPRGHNLLICPYVMHRDAAYFEEPERFFLERWSGVRVTSPAYLPFGRGPHGCPGNEVALVMLVAILLTVLAQCEIALGPGEVSPDPRSTLRPAGLEMTFTRR